MRMDEVDTVKAIYRYPVKSMRGECLSSANFRWTGIDGDRQYAFLRANNRSRFPWLTGRELPELVTYSARYADPDNPRHSEVRVAIGDGEYDIWDAQLVERLSRVVGEEIRAMQVGRGTFDSMPISVLSTATLALMEAQCQNPVDMRRFRANILVATSDGQAARETNWIGGTLIFGDGPKAVRLRINTPIDRCVMITIDPEVGTRDPAILRRVVGAFNNEIGVRCSVEATGTTSIDDCVRLVRSTGPDS